MKKYALIVSWLISTVIVWSVGADLLTINDTVLNIAGILILAGWLGLSYETKCFTYKLNEDEKNN